MVRRPADSRARSRHTYALGCRRHLPWHTAMTVSLAGIRESRNVMLQADTARVPGVIDLRVPAKDDDREVPALQERQADSVPVATGWWPCPSACQAPLDRFGTRLPAGGSQTKWSSNQVTVRPPRRRQPHRAASRATSSSPRPLSASPSNGRGTGTPGPLRSVTSTVTALLSADRDRDRLAGRARVAVPQAVPEQLAHQQDRVFPAGVPRAKHRAHEHAGHPRPLRPPGECHGLPGRCPRHAHRAFPSALVPENHAGGHSDARPTQRRTSSRNAPRTASPWPSAEGQRLHQTRYSTDAVRYTSVPQHHGLQGDTMRHQGTARKRPAEPRKRSALMRG
jgi:hypothetical protein